MTFLLKIIFTVVLSNLLLLFHLALVHGEWSKDKIKNKIIGRFSILTIIALITYLWFQKNSLKEDPQKENLQLLLFIKNQLGKNIGC